jgi:vancomycin resistance protein YoaR
MKKKILKKVMKRTLWISTAVTSLIILLLFFTPQQVPSGVQIGGELFGGLSKNKALHQLEKLSESFQKRTILFQFDDHETSQLSSSQLGIEFDITATWRKMIGHESLLSRLLSSSVGAAGSETPRKIEPQLRVDEQHLSQVVSSLLSSHERSVKNAQLVWTDDQWKIGTEIQGESLSAGEKDRVQTLLIESIQNSNIPSSLLIQYDPIEPEIKSPDLEEVKNKLDSFVMNPLKINFNNGGETIDFTDTETQELLNIEGSQVTLDTEKLRKWISRYAQERNLEPGRVKITGTEEIESEYDGKSFTKAVYEGTFASGWIIDEEKLFENISNAFDDQEERMVSVNVRIVPPTITSEIEGVSFPDLLSTGKSNFEEGNGADRVKNIDLSLGAFHSVIVPAGESFSMNRTTGWITEDKGYTKTKVIYGGAVGTGVGGGVCQTSTTLYRAVINAGLPVTERRPHTLDVSYYHKYGYGLDAAVYTVARKDFQFVNDTGSPILINTYIAPSDEAIVEIYGTSDGRTVELKNIPTGIRNYKKWNWFVKWPEKEEKRVIDSIYLR